MIEQYGPDDENYAKVLDRMAQIGAEMKERLIAFRLKEEEDE